MAWPTRTRLCVTCRRTLADDEACHDAVALAVVDERNALVRKVWGTTDIGHLPTHATGDTALIKALTGIGLAALSVAAIVGRGLRLVIPSLVFVLVGLTALAPVLVSAYRKRYEIGTKRSARPKGLPPVGAESEPGTLPPAKPSSGVIADGASLPAPVTDQPCVAFALTLRSAASDQRPLLLRDSRTVGFTIETDDGRRIAVQPGAIELGTEGEPTDPFRARIHLATVDPHYESDDGPDPFAFDEASLAVLEVGDRVDFLGDVRVAVDPKAKPTHYRESAGSVLVPRGTPTVVKRVPTAVD